jgi:hypothetical protein
MEILGDEKTVAEYMEGALETGVTLQSFTKAFLNYPAAQELRPSVKRMPVRLFFKIADEFLRLRVAAKEAKRLKMIRDYQQGTKLIAGTQKRMTDFLAFLQKFPTTGRARTPPIARFVCGIILPAQKQLEKTLEDTLRNIAAQQSLVEGLRRKTEVYEYIIDLERFISGRFPKMKVMDKAVLVGAALAGAKLFTEDDLSNDPQGRLPRKIFLAMRYYKKQYQDPGIERAFPVLATPKKKRRVPSAVTIKREENQKQSFLSRKS